MALALGLAWSTTAHAAEAWRCTASDGSVSFQDRPCASDQRSTRIAIAQDPAPPPRSADADRGDGDADDTARSAAAPPASSAREPSSSWLCTRGEDGARYLSDDGIGQQRAVPLAMLGAPSRSLADTYGRGGVGISAPGAGRPPPVLSGGADGLGAAYVWVQDTCEPVRGAALCAFLGQELEASEQRLRYAFSDIQAQARRERDAWRARLDTCVR
ncbi:DUF4124 domain-containing protein [Dokdonella sp. MW10]|uniref:DUF4124 domain-containing protein n=1 Tax=Dokdonella sp. MW10 TaxID=2992926 RepID=UPI003F7DD8FF